MKKFSFLLILLLTTSVFGQKTKPHISVVSVQPTNFTPGIFGGTQHTVVLSWTASTTPGVDYNGYRGTTSLQETKYVTGITTTTFTDTGVTQGSTYFYYVTAYNPTTLAESSGSNEVSATIPVNPAPPTNLTETTQ